MRTSDYENEYEPRVRPSFLTILCILTFIGSGMAIVSSVFAYKTAGKTDSILSQIAKGNTDTVNNATVTIKDSTYVNDSLNVADSVIKHEETKPTSELEIKMQRSAAKMFTKENIQKKSIGDFLAAIFTLTGAILMWNLRRQGFYVYIIGVLISFFVPLYLYGTDLLSIGMSIISAFFGLVFIALYALNLKAMRGRDEEIVDLD